ncbi:MAG: NAD(P)H-hydrate epimerase [Balneolaceae bacterium]
MSLQNLPYSHRVSTGDQAREADRKTIELFGMDGFTLMETAGLQAAQFISGKSGPGAVGLYVCGKGNNGGDALVIARYLAIHQNHTCHIIFPAGKDSLSPDAQKNLELLLKLRSQNEPVHFHEQGVGTDENSDDCLSAACLMGGPVDYVVDGLLGTGLSDNLRPPYNSAVKKINRLTCPVYSVDIPTGLHADTGKAMPDAVHADYTLSFGTLKVGFYLHDGRQYTGEIRQFNLSFPKSYRPATAELITPDLDKVIPHISRFAEHKYSDRILYLIAGSEGLTGAAVMAAASGWRTGTGAVILITPKGLLGIYEKTLPGIIKSPVGTGRDTFFKEGHQEKVLDILKRKKGVLLIGPGLGSRDTTIRFTERILSGFEQDTVIDADALRAVPDLPVNRNWILTPHPGEAHKLHGKSFEDDFERLQWAADYSKQRSLYMVSKGNPVFIGTPEGKNYLTGYDTRIFARAGFGDVLSGKIAGNLAISGDIELSIVRALIDGYRTAERIRLTSDRPLEPNDLI